MVRTKTYSLPSKIKAIVVQDPNGDYDIVINANLSRKEQLEAYRHEIAHITKHDFERHDADEIERTT